MQSIIYTIKELRHSRDAGPYMAFFVEVARSASKMYGDLYDWNNFDLDRYLWSGRIVICERDGKPVGVMLSRILSSLFDHNVKILKQDLLYAQPGTRAAHVLMKDFIDFGKLHANHIVTMIGEKTNIKGKTLEKIGFKKLEQYYRIEV